MTILPYTAIKGFIIGLSLFKCEIGSHWHISAIANPKLLFFTHKQISYTLDVKQ